MQPQVEVMRRADVNRLYDEKVNKYSLTEVKDVIMVVGVIWIDGLFDLD